MVVISGCTYLPPPYVVRRRLFFHRCVSVRGVVPHSQVLSQVSGPRPFLTFSYPSLAGGTPVLATPARTGLGYPPPPSQDRTRVPPGQDCGTPPPETKHQSEYLLRIGRYAFLPFTVTQEDFLVLMLFLHYFIHRCKSGYNQSRTRVLHIHLDRNSVRTSSRLHFHALGIQSLDKCS